MRQWESMKIHQNNFTKISFILLSLAIWISAQPKADNKTVLANFDKNIENGKLAEIERDLFNYVVANPKDAAGFSLLAKLRLKQDRLNEAKSLANKALLLDENLLSAKLTLAQTSIQLGEIEQSRQVLNSISETEILDNVIRLNLAQIFETIGDCANSLKLVEKLPIKTKNTEALPLRANCYLATGDKKNFASLLPIAKTLVKQNPNIANGFAEILAKSGLHKETAELLRMVIFSAPKNQEALLLLAKSEIYLKDLANAKVHLGQAEKIEPDSAEFLFIKSLLESEQGNNAQAFELLEKTLAANPNNLQALAQFVVVSMRANQTGKAVRAAEKLLNLQPENLEFIYLYGAASLQNNNLQKAESSLIKYFSARPNDSRGCLALGLAYAGQIEKLDQARQQMQKCLQINPRNFEASYQLGLSYKTAGDSAKSIEYFEQTIKLSPNYAAALRDLGAAYLQIGVETKARPVLEKAVSLNPNDADTHFQLSRLYNIIGERELAKKHLEIFQKLRTPKKDGM